MVSLKKEIFLCLTSALLISTYSLGQDNSLCQDILRKGKTYIEKGDLALALEYYSSRLQDAPNPCKGQLYLKVGAVLLNQKKFEDALIYLRSAKQIAESSGDLKLLAQSEINLGATLTSAGDLVNGLFEYKQALIALESYRNDTLTAITNFNLAHNYKEKALFDKSIEHLSAAIVQFEGLSSKDYLAKCYQTLGNLYREVGKDSLSIIYLTKALDFWKNVSKKNEVSTNLNDLGNTYMSLYDFRKALEYYNESLMIGDSLYRATTFGNIAKAYVGLNELEKAKWYIQKSISLRKAEPDSKALSQALTDLGGILIKMNMLTNARQFLIDGEELAIVGEYNNILLENLGYQINLAELDDDLGRAYQLLKKRVQINEQVFNKDKQLIIEQTSIAFEVRDLERENSYLSEQSSLSQAIARKEKSLKQYFRAALVLTLLLLLVLGYVYYQNRKYAKWQKIKRQEIQHRTKNFLQTLINLFQFQTSSLTDPSVIALVKQSQSRVDAMIMIHRLLTNNIDTLNFSDYAKDLVDHISKGFNVNQLDVDIYFDTQNVALKADQATPLALILNELVNNVFKHAFQKRDNSKLAISIQESQNILKLTVWDNGSGSVGKLDSDDPTGKGLQLVNLLVKQLNGYIEVDNSEGTQITVSFKVKPTIKMAGSNLNGSKG